MKPTDNNHFAPEPVDVEVPVEETTFEQTMEGLVGTLHDYQSAAGDFSELLHNEKDKAAVNTAAAIAAEETGDAKNVAQTEWTVPTKQQQRRPSATVTEPGQANALADDDFLAVKQYLGQPDQNGTKPNAAPERNLDAELEHLKKTLPTDPSDIGRKTPVIHENELDSLKQLLENAKSVPKNPLQPVNDIQKQAETKAASETNAADFTMPEPKQTDTTSAIGKEELEEIERLLQAQHQAVPPEPEKEPLDLNVIIQGVHSDLEKQESKQRIIPEEATEMDRIISDYKQTREQLRAMNLPHYSPSEVRIHKPHSEQQHKLSFSRAAVTAAAILILLGIAFGVYGRTAFCGPSQIYRDALVVRAEKSALVSWIPDLFLGHDTVEQIIAEHADEVK